MFEDLPTPEMREVAEKAYRLITLSDLTNTQVREVAAAVAKNCNKFPDLVDAGEKDA